MAIAARKTESQLRYAPRTRVYAQGAACPAAEPVGQPRPKPGHGAARPAGPRVTRIARQPKVNLYVDAGRLLFTTMGVLSAAALLIILLVRYAIISQEYAVVNQIREQIVACNREIDILNVQLNAAVSLDQAREAALEAGMGYPQADQIVRIQGAEPSLAGGQAAPQ